MELQVKTRYLVQSDWLTELPKMERPILGSFTGAFPHYQNELKLYEQHLASLPKICRCEGLEDGKIVEENVDFEWEQKNPDSQYVAIHREQGEGEDEPPIDLIKAAHYAGWYNGLINAYRHDFSWEQFIGKHKLPEGQELVTMKQLLDYGEWARVHGERHRGNLQKNGKQLYDYYLKDKERWETAQRNG